MDSPFNSNTFIRQDDTRAGRRLFSLKTMARAGHEITAQVKLPNPTVLDYTASFINKQRTLVRDIVKLQGTWVKNWVSPKA